jgi:hypothetical protein
MSPLPFFNGNIRECQLGGVGFPVSRVMTNFGNDVVQHKYPNVPGANLEPMGKNPKTFMVQALFINGLKRSSTETWSDLYPETYDKIIAFFEDPNNPTIVFQHPTIGTFNVKCIHGSTEVSYNCLNGQVVDFELMQDGNNNATIGILVPNEQANGQQSAISFQQGLDMYAEDNPDIDITALPDLTDDFYSNLFSVSIGTTQGTIVSVGTAAATCSNAVSQNTVAGQQLLALNDPTNASLMINLESMNSALNDVVTSNTNGNIFTVNVPMTLNQVLLQLLPQNNNLTIENLIALNPQLALSPTISVGTNIYWQ